MVRKSKGTWFKSRNLLKKSVRKKGMPPLSVILREYTNGDRVTVILEPSVQKGRPHRRFHGKTGKIVGKRGRSYLINIKDMGREKLIISRPEHLRPQL
ncbi:MAG: 50S ribosomal protein L21e [Candidatus Heimdallarchaeota archaeon]